MKRGTGRLAGALLLLFAACGVHAVEGNLVVTLSQNLQDQWEHILPGRPPQVSTVSRVVPGQPFSIRLVLGRFALKDGAADVTADLEQVNPDGTKEAIGRDLVILRGKSDGKGVFLSNFYLEAVMEEKDAPGTYRIVGKLRDRNDGSEKPLECSWQLTPPPDPYPTVELKQSGEVLSNYYRSPKPELLPGFLESCLRERPGLNGKTLSLYYGLGLLFRLNPQLHGELLRIAAAQQTAESRRAVAAVIHFLGREAGENLHPKLDEATSRELDELVLLPDEVPDTIRTPGELDQLWFEFFATGKVEPVRRLVEQLARPGEMLTPKEFKAKKEKGETTPEDLEKLKNFLITLAANWSLNSNAKQHPLVRYYLEAMLTRGEIKHPRSAALVKEILRKASLPEKAGK